MSTFSSGTDALLTKLVEALTTYRPVSNVPAALVIFDPDAPDSDIVNWCSLSEIVIKSMKVEGIDLILALTRSLKGRAVMCLTKIKPNSPGILSKKF